MSQPHKTVAQVNALRVDALYGKKKHFNASDRKQKYHVRMGIAAIVLNLVLASVAFKLLGDTVPEIAKWAAALLALVASILVALQTFLKYQETIEGHRSIAGRYLVVAKKCSRLIAYCEDDTFTHSALRQELEKLAAINDQINTDAQAFSTSNGDYEKAKAGFDAGEECYTEEELGGD